MSDFPFSGLTLAMSTPFNEDGTVAYDKLPDHLERYLDAGISSFLLSSGTGMHVYLSRQESDELVPRCSKVLDGRARTIVQTSSLLLDDVVSRTRHAADCGADGVMVLPPFFEGPTNDDDVFAFYEAVGEAGLPIIGYNVPAQAGVEITPDLFRRLIEIPNFVTVKDSAADIVKQADLIRTGLPVMNGADPLTAYSLFAGISGLIWGSANFAPKLCGELVAAGERGDWTTLREIWSRLEPVMSALWQGDYVQSVYSAAELTGFGAGNARRPFSPQSAEQVNEVRALLTRAGILDA